MSLVPAGVLSGYMVAAQGNGDEQPPYIQPGHLRVAFPRHHSLAALAVGGQRALLPSRHGAGAVLGSVWPSSSVSAAVALVAAVRVSLSRPHRLAPGRSPGAAGVSGGCLLRP